MLYTNDSLLQKLKLNQFMIILKHFSNTSFLASMTKTYTPKPKSVLNPVRMHFFYFYFLAKCGITCVYSCTVSQPHNTFVLMLLFNLILHIMLLLVLVNIAPLRLLTNKQKAKNKNLPQITLPNNII